MKELLVSAAFNEAGTIVRPSEGKSGDAYTCIECQGPLLWRKCVTLERRSHFAHRGESTCSGGEGLVHKKAKLLVEKDILHWLEGGTMPAMVFPCHQCGQDCPQIPLTALGSVAWAKAEHTFTHEVVNGLRADVAVKGEDGTWGAIEIMATHPIDDDKIARYAQAKTWWVEIQANPVLQEPPIWKVLRSSKPASRGCWECADERWCEAEERWNQAEDLDRERENVELANNQRWSEVDEFHRQIDNRLSYREDLIAQKEKDLAQKEKDLQSHERQDVLDELEAQIKALAKIHLNPQETIAHARLVDLRKLEAVYKEVYEGTERLRRKNRSLSGTVHVHPTTCQDP